MNKQDTSDIVRSSPEWRAGDHGGLLVTSVGVGNGYAVTAASSIKPDFKNDPWVKTNIELLVNELKRELKDKLSPEELERAKEIVFGSWNKFLEEMSSRAARR